MVRKRKLTDARMMDSPPRMIRPDEEILLFEIQATLDLNERYSMQAGIDSSEGRLNKEYGAHAKALEDLFEDEEFYYKVYRLASSLHRMDVIRRVKEEKISISKFSDKYGNEYLKAKAAYPTFKIVDGKKKIMNKSISIHLGRLEQFPGGVNDEKAKSEARMKLLKKAKQMMDVKIIGGQTK